MKFKKEIAIIIEGEIFDESINPTEIFERIKLSWKHWWENNPNWIYGTPSETMQVGRIDKISIKKNDK